MIDSYHNTTGSDGDELDEYEGKAKSQESRIMGFYNERYHDLGFTPSEIRARVFDDKPPITSVRRAMTNLTNAGRLVKTEQQRRGPEGRPEHVWRLPGPPEQTNLF